MKTAVELVDVSRLYGSVRAADNVNLNIMEGEFFSMLGPSGSGKTTCLRLIAGFEKPTHGEIIIHGRNASETPPYDRDVNTVFQDYALFPHMSNLENIEYGLKVKGIAKAERRERALTALEMVALTEAKDRRPSQLSGGQRQRIALARAIVNRPRVLLLDEPLGALDLKLREQMQTELKALQRKLGITFIYVTHDQGEAFSMSDRVAVFNSGKIEQVDTPENLYKKPATAFVAGFVGKTNIVTESLAQQLTGKARSFSIRPEHIRFTTTTTSDDYITVAGTLTDIQYFGSHHRYDVAVDDGIENPTIFSVQIASTTENKAALPKIGEPANLCWSMSEMAYFEH